MKQRGEKYRCDQATHASCQLPSTTLFNNANAPPLIRGGPKKLVKFIRFFERKLRNCTVDTGFSPVWRWVFKYVKYISIFHSRATQINRISLACWKEKGESTSKLPFHSKKIVTFWMFNQVLFEFSRFGT